MTYFAQSACSYQGCGSGMSTGISEYSGGCCSSGSGYSSIDSVVSSYSGPAASTMESAVQGNSYQPVFSDPDQGSRPSYGVAESINAAIYGGIIAGYSPREKKQSHQPLQDNFLPDIFLNRNRPASPFIGSSEDIKHYVREAFEKTTGKSFPDDMIIRVVSTHELREFHEDFGGSWSPGIQGLSINKKGFGQSIILVRENDLDRLLITIGHEIGHVMNFPLSDKIDEEAKAFAFEMAWIKKLYESNIAGMKNSINTNPCPARNGIHDVAFNWVKDLVRGGTGCFDIIRDLMQKKVSARGDNDVLLQ